MTPDERKGVIDECIQVIQRRGNAAAQIIEDVAAKSSARRAAVAALNFYNQMVWDLRSLKAN